MIESQRTESWDDIISKERANLTSLGSVLATCTSTMKGLHPPAWVPTVDGAPGQREEKEGKALL